jgi:hypothetical protein
MGLAPVRGVEAFAAEGLIDGALAGEVEILERLAGREPPGLHSAVASVAVA